MPRNTPEIKLSIGDYVLTPGSRTAVVMDISTADKNLTLRFDDGHEEEYDLVLINGEWRVVGGK